MTTPKTEPDDSVSLSAMKLMADLMEHSAKGRDSIINGLMEGYRRDAVRYRLRLEAVQANTLDLLNGPYAPSGKAIMEAVFDVHVSESEVTEELRQGG